MSPVDEGNWLIFADQSGVADAIARHLAEQNANVVTVRIGPEFRRVDDISYTVRPSQLADYKALINELNAQERSPHRIFHLWLTDGEVPGQQDRGYNSLINLTQALASEMVTHSIQLGVVMTDVQEVTGEEEIAPAKALALGACTVIPQEYANITCRRIDVALPNSDLAKERLSRQLLTEILGKSEDLIVAYRGPHRWVQIFEPTRLEPETLGSTRLKEGGVYLITGGLGGIGLVFAEHLSKNYKAKLVLTGRTSLPPREKWADWLATHEESETTARKILRVREIEALGGEVEVLSADVADEMKMGQAIAAARNRFQRIDGVIHTAGLGGTEMIQQLTPEISKNVLTPKVKGTEVVFDLLKDDHLDFVALCSSVASILGGFAMADYCAANVYLDAFAHRQASRNGTQTVAINWDRWQEVGMAANPETTTGLSAQQQAELNKGIRTTEGVDAFERILRTNLGQVIVSTSNFDAKVTKSVKLKVVDDSGAGAKNSETLTYHPRPVLRSEYTAPRNDVDRALIDMWQGLLGIEEVGIHDNFFELGGHSLLATQFISRVRDTFKVELSLRQLFESGTIAELSEIIVAAESQRGQIGRIAQLLVMVENMSAEEVSRSLQERTQS